MAKLRTDNVVKGNVVFHEHGPEDVQFIQRNLSSNLSLSDGQCLTFVNYIKLNSYSLTLAGDSAVLIK